jgi:hypothetical protein
MLGEHRTGEIELACADLPRSARPMVRRALPEVRSVLEGHAGAFAELEEGLSG